MLIKCLSFTSALFLMLLVNSSVAYGQKKQEKAVRACFDGYKEAISNEKGEKAASFVDNHTIAYYTDILTLVRQADSASVQALSISDKLMVLMIRHRTAKHDMLTFSGRDLFVFAVNEGMVGKSNLPGATIGEVTFKGASAEGQFVHQGQPSPFSFGFNQENGKWKIDLTSIFPVSNMAFQNMVAESGQPEDAYLLSLLAMLTGREPGPDIWQPVLP
jgi:hypothetical protein